MATVVLANCLIVTVVVMIHYECLVRLNHYLPQLPVAARLRIVIGILGALIAHALEVWVFAAAYYWMHKSPLWGHLEGNFSGSLADCAYFSFVTYTTLGYGDIKPLGNLRYLTGIEALTGLVLITWTASFLYLEMRRNWDNSAKNH